MKKKIEELIKEKANNIYEKYYSNNVYCGVKSCNITFHLPAQFS